MNILSKLSEPGWDKEYEDMADLKIGLYSCLCFQCKCEDGITEVSAIGDMLATSCGAEYSVEIAN